MPHDDKTDIKHVEADHGPAFPKMHSTIQEEDHGKADRHDEEDNVAHKCLPADLELANEGHGASDDSSDEASSTYQLANGHTAAVGIHGGESAEDIGGAIPKGQKSDACQALWQTEDAGNGAQVDAEEVARGDANGGEEKTQPEGQDGECDGPGAGKRTVVKGEIGHQARFILGTMRLGEGALVSGEVDLIADDIVFLGS